MKTLLSAVALGLLSWTSAVVYAGEVVDLGSLQIQGKMRGPEVQVIDSSRLHRLTAEVLIRWQLQQMEKKAIVFESPFEEKVLPKGGKKK